MSPFSRAIAWCLMACICSKAFSQDDPWADDIHTVILNADNLTSFVSSTKLCMVEFYTPWCGHCRGFAKDYTRAAAELKKDGIVLAKVSLDDPKNHPLASQFGVQGFPTIRIFKRMYDSPPQPYGATVENFDTQPRTYESVVQHMRNLGSPPEQIENLERLQSYRQLYVRYD